MHRAPHETQRGRGTLEADLPAAPLPGEETPRVEVDDEWRRWIAENLLVDEPAESIQKSMKELRAFSQAMADDPITVSNLVEDHIALQMFEEELNKLVKNCTETP